MLGNPESPEARGLHCELPAGLGDLLPEAAGRFFRLRRNLLNVLERWGYRPVVPPLLEYGEVFDRALSDAAEIPSVYRLVDRATGHGLAIRPDFTPQLARLVSTRLSGASLPLRLCYEGPVLRHVPARRGRSRELHQVGAELIGVRDPEADAEAIALVIHCLREARVTDFKVDVGQVEFFRGVLQDVDLPAEQIDQLTGAVARKDVSEVSSLLERLPVSDGKKRLLAELPLLAGGTEVLDRAAGLVESEHSRRALANLEDVVRFVEVHGLTEHLTIDLGELRGIDYHTGVIFEAFVHHLGVPLCRGGRYDGLFAAFGPDLPATGFTLDLFAVMEACDLGAGPTETARPGGVFIINFDQDRSRALQLARRLRAEGTRTARDLMSRPIEQSLAHAREQGFRRAIVLGQTAGRGEATVIDLLNGTEETVVLEAIPTRVAKEV